MHYRSRCWDGDGWVKHHPALLMSSYCRRACVALTDLGSYDLNSVMKWGRPFAFSWAFLLLLWYHPQKVASDGKLETCLILTRTGNQNDDRKCWWFGTSGLLFIYFWGKCFYKKKKFVAQKLSHMLAIHIKLELFFFSIKPFRFRILKSQLANPHGPQKSYFCPALFVFRRWSWVLSLACTSEIRCQRNLPPSPRLPPSYYFLINSLLSSLPHHSIPAHFFVRWWFATQKVTEISLLHTHSHSLTLTHSWISLFFTHMHRSGVQKDSEQNEDSTCIEIRGLGQKNILTKTDKYIEGRV